MGMNYWKLWTASVVSNLGDGVAQIAYPWLASAVTRDPVLIALIAVAQRLPWLIFTLPAGVITDRVDRKKIMSWTSLFRTVLTGLVTVVVLVQTDMLPTPSEIVDGAEFSTNLFVYGTLLVASLLFGMAEVLFDNSAQTILPAIVEPEGLEKANGRLWGAEMVANSFVGPPLGSLMIGVAFALPFVFDMGTFAVAAVFIFLLSGAFASPTESGVAHSGKRASGSFMADIKQGVSWLWAHPLLRPMAIILGLLNGLGAVTAATFILFAQEVLGVDAFTFAILGMAGAVGGVVGSVAAPRISEKLGSGTSLYITLAGQALLTVAIGVSSNWVVVAASVRCLHRYSGVVERDHRVAETDDHPGSPARTGQQRVPVLCVGHDADRARDRWAPCFPWRGDRDVAWDVAETPILRFGGCGPGHVLLGSPAAHHRQDRGSPRRRRSSASGTEGGQGRGCRCVRTAVMLTRASV